MNTYGKWKTMRVDLTDFYKDVSQSNGTYLNTGWNGFVFSYQPTVDVEDDFSICNFRIVKK
ncbi:glycan-binding surface protein [Sphingobacterium sp. IITKGP-BTPF85]|uniref:glycan-binding surface protein n=1 Tax=Sphingobacterium sp. IITKGP-BTPF85 TaxID=1338009 RepID=UPI0003FB54FB|nr:glycan-binding surface protein [Sphingobacterium sp. IITKGP-BTPF85]